MCTSVRFTDTKGNMVFGRNLDWSFSYGEKVVVTPRGYAPTWAYDGSAGGAAVADGDQAVIGMAVVVDNIPLYFDCANESGLGIAGLNFPGFATYEDDAVDGKVNIASYEFPYWVARNFKTVDEVEKVLGNVAIVGKEIGKFPPSMLHWIIADKSRSIVVEYMDSGMHVHHDDVDVLTNQPQFDWHIENLRNYMALTPEVPADVDWRGQKLSAYGSGFGMLGLPGAFNSPSRFVRAAYLNAHYPDKETEKENVARLFHTLTGVAMVDGGAAMTDGDFEKTIYTGGYIEASKTYYWNSYDDISLRSVCMGAYDLSAKDLVVTDGEQ